MDCDRYRHAISARLDGEDACLDAIALDRHLRACAGCRHWEGEVTRLTRTVRLGEAEPIPDLTPAILLAIDRQPPPRRFDPVALRAALAAVAAVQLVAGLPALIFGASGGVTAHVARDLGSFDLALAVGFLFAAWRPILARGMLPPVATLVAGLAVGTAVDLAHGRAGPLAESAHLLEVVSLVLLWLLTRAAPGATARLRVAAA